MPVTVPDEPKKYTTVYENFKGVDFTNDPSNVYKRRSPGGKNMLPDLDGRPYKRKGWKIEYSAQDFIDAAGSSATTVTPKRIHHFSLGGKEYLMLFNSLGVFYTAEDMDTVVKCQLAKTVNGTTTYSAFPPPIDGVNLEADSGRTFFFEANGVAGLYTFVGTSLFRFDGQYYWEVDPYTPVILIACDADGTGVMLDNVNLLTNRRTVQYAYSANDVAFAVPSGIDTSKPYSAEKLDAAGQWIPAGGTYSNGVMSFTSPPATAIVGEDCLRITYYPANIATYLEVLTDTKTAYRYEDWNAVRRRWCYPKKVGETRDDYYTTMSEGTHSFSYDDAIFSLSNPKNINEVTVTPTGGTLTTNAYSNKVTYRPASSDYVTPSGSPLYRTTGEKRKAAISVYCSTDRQALQQAGNNNDFSNVTYIGTCGSSAYTSNYYSTADLTSEATMAFEDFISNYQASRSTQYYYAYNYESDAKNRATKNAVCSISYESYNSVSTDGDTIGDDKNAFMACQRSTVYGSGIINQVFMGASIANGYRSRMWYSAVGRPDYFPDLNYVEVGSNDTAIMGMVKCGEYLGVVKAGNALDSSIYLAYPTSFDDDTTYVVRQSIAGIGALSTGAFNILAEEPVFLSSEGVMAIELVGENRLRNRSYFVDKRLCAEQGLSDAVSYVFQNMYYLSINNHCYVLDGSQKSSWANEKTNLQYECYYLDNIPAQCFGDMGGYLWFTDYDGNLCRFKTGFDDAPYRDEYVVGHTAINADDMNVVGDDGIVINIGDLRYTSDGTTHFYTRDELETGMLVRFYSAGDFSVASLTDDTITLSKGVPVDAVWDTIADDDGAIHFFKNLNKKGFVVSLLPGSSSGVTVWLKPDEKDPIKYGTTDANGNLLPFDYFVRKKVKKYKRLQIICENNGLDQSFGVDQILKTYTLGNYSKNRK